ILALTIPEVPRVVRLVRALVLSLREQPVVEAMQAAGAGIPRILFRHIMPNTLAPVLVQATYICASAVIVEAYLSFLGAGTPPNVPSWGNIMAEGRSYVQLAFWIIFFPGLFVAITVLAINLVGDGLRDRLDPTLAPRMSPGDPCLRYAAVIRRPSAHSSGRPKTKSVLPLGAVASAGK